MIATHAAASVLPDPSSTEVGQRSVFKGTMADLIEVISETTSDHDESWKRMQFALHLELLRSKPSKAVPPPSGVTTTLPTGSLSDDLTYADISMMRDMLRMLEGTIEHLSVKGNTAFLDPHSGKYVLRRRQNADAYTNNMDRPSEGGGPTLRRLRAVDPQLVNSAPARIEDIKKKIIEKQNEISLAEQKTKETISSGDLSQTRELMQGAAHVRQLNSQIAGLREQLEVERVRLKRTGGETPSEQDRVKMLRGAAAYPVEKHVVEKSLMEPLPKDKIRSEDYRIKAGIRLQRDDLEKLIVRLESRRGDGGHVDIKAWKDEWQAYTEIRSNVTQLLSRSVAHQAQRSYWRSVHRRGLAERLGSNLHGLELNPDEAKISDKEAIDLFNLIYKGKKIDIDGRQTTVEAFVGTEKEFREFYARLFLNIKELPPGNSSFYFMPRDQLMQANIRMLREVKGYAAYNVSENSFVLRTLRLVSFNRARKERQREFSARPVSNDAELAMNTLNGYMEKMLFMGPEYRDARRTAAAHVSRVLRSDLIALGQWQADITRNANVNAVTAVALATGVPNVGRTAISFGGV